MEHKTKRYKLKVIAVDETDGQIATLTGSFRVFGNQEQYFCSANMINTETQPVQGCLEYITVGNATNFTCKIRDRDNVLHIPTNGPCK